MSVVRLPPRPQPLPVLEADPGLIRTYGEQMLAASAQVDDLGTFVAGAARIDDWYGQGGTAYAVAIRPLGRQADAMSLALRGVGQRVLGHADEMHHLLERHDDLAERRVAILRDLEWLRAEAASVTEADVASVQAEADLAAARGQDWETDRTRWSVQVAAEEAEMMRAFARVLTLRQVTRHYDGTADPADDAVAGKPPPGSDPEAVHGWWISLTRAQRRAIIGATPGAIGNLDGIPASVRDLANTIRLDRDLAALGERERAGVLTDDEHRLLDNVRAADEARHTIEDSRDPVTGDPVETSVYVYDPGAFGGDGGVAIAAGDPDTADNVAVTVPGFGTDASNAGYLADRTVDMYEAARTLDPDATNATMFWIGYDAPDNMPFTHDSDGDAAGVLREGFATAGGRRLSDLIDGMRAGRHGDAAHLAVVGHSYGSTTVGHGAYDHGLAADDIVVVGSPGLGSDVDSADDLGVDPSHVWAGANSHDPVAYVADDGALNGSAVNGSGLGNDPVEDDFGAHRFEAESTTRDDQLEVGGHQFSIGDHTKYFDHDTESLHNITEVVNGNYEAVQGAGHVHDPIFGGPHDPEVSRIPTTPDTDGR